MKKNATNKGFYTPGSEGAWKVVNVSENTFRRIKRAIDDKIDWIRKVQSGEITYTKGRVIE